MRNKIILSLALLMLLFTVTPAYAAYHVFQNKDYLNTFSHIKYALDYAKKFDHAKVTDGNSEVLWHNYGYQVYYDDVYVKTCNSFYDTQDSAVLLSGSIIKIIDGLTNEVVWNSKNIFMDSIMIDPYWQFDADKLVGNQLWINGTNYSWYGIPVQNLEEVTIVQITRRPSIFTDYSNKTPNGKYAKEPEYIIKIQKSDGTEITLGETFPSFNSLDEVLNLFYTENPYREYNWSEKVWNKIRAKKVSTGMNKEQVIMSWGYPERNNRTVGSWGVHEQWVYGNQYLYFENGILTSFQD